jgi:ATPase family AAA domain-containing protein 3A/B
MKAVILDPGIEARLKNVALSTQNTKRNRAPFRHLLLYGPPGTGKTLFAKGLAQYSGMDYAILTGGDVAPLGRDAVTEIHKVFEWTQSSKRGLLLFVDEADAFLRRRSTESMSEDLRNALNAFLFRTGESSDKFMVVYASNEPEQFDWAINDRIDEMVEFKLPASSERFRMLCYYMDQLMESMSVNGASQPKRLTVDDDVSEALLRSFAEETHGFSGRALSKLAAAWQAAAYGSNPPHLDRTLMEEVLASQIDQRRTKDAWVGVG